MRTVSPIMASIAACSCLLFITCKQKNNTPAKEDITALQLKRGAVVTCGPPNQQFGSVAFENSCSPKAKADFDLALALLHSFEYDEAEKVFAKIIDEERGTAIAYWGVAMANFHPLWSPPTGSELEKGAKAIAIAQSLSNKTKREADYINATAQFYKDYDKKDHRSRALLFEKAMEKIHADYPKDEEAAVFYALALNGAADPADKTFSRQKKAGDMLAAMYSEKTNHPGLVHYIIHSYDSPLLAPLGLAAARKYASVAPSSAHAQHMPSHIFVRMGYWDEVIQSNTVAAESARCYAESTGLEGHWDEELHCLDYLIYAYLQKGDNTRAKQEWDYLKDMKKIEPVNFKVAYAFAAIPSRYVLENKMWKEAATLEINPIGFSWQQYPWQSAILYYTRGLGSAHAGNIAAAKTELGKLRSIQDTLARQKDAYKANLVQVQANTVEAWTLFKEGKTADALKLMTDAADLEDNTQKMAVTPSEVLPARELLGDMLLQLNEPAKALQEYEASLLQHANRFNGLYDAALAAERSGNKEKAKSYYQRLLSIADPKDQERTELKTARLYLNKI